MTDTQAIVCLDIDGTLIDDHEQMHPEDIKVLTSYPEKIQLVLTTGRPVGSAKGVLHANNLFQDTPLPLPGVFMNGTAAYLREEELLLEYHFSEEVRQELINLGHSFPGSTFAFFTLSTTHLVNPTPFSFHIAEKHYLSHQISKPFEVPPKINKMMVIENDKDKLNRIKMHTDGLTAEIAYSLPYLLEFTPKGVNKPAVLKPLLSALSLKGVPIYAAGDGQNDLALFDLAEVSFAPSTAHQSILKRVDYIIQREDEGLLHPIIEIVNQKIRDKS